MHRFSLMLYILTLLFGVITVAQEGNIPISLSSNIPSSTGSSSSSGGSTISSSATVSSTNTLPESKLSLSDESIASSSTTSSPGSTIIRSSSSPITFHTTPRTDPVDPTSSSSSTTSGGAPTAIPTTTPPSSNTSSPSGNHTHHNLANITSGGRVSPAQLKQLGFLLEENKRLKAELSEVHKLLEIENRSIAKRALEEAHIRAAEDLRIANEKAVELAKLEEEKIKLELQIVLEQKAAALANESAINKSLQTAIEVLETTRLQEKVLSLETAKKEAELALAKELTKFAEMDKEEAEKSAVVWEAIRKSAESNATALTAAATIATENTRAAQEERKKLELESKIAEEERRKAEISKALLDKDIQAQQALINQAEAKAKAAEEELKRWLMEYQTVESVTKVTEEMQLTLQDTKLATNQLKDITSEVRKVMNESVQIFQASTHDAIRDTFNDPESKALLSSDNLTITKLQLELEIAQTHRDIDLARLEYISKELQRSLTAYETAALAVDTQNKVLQEKQLEVLKLETEVKQKTLVAEESTLILRTKEAEIQLQELRLEQTQAKEHEAILIMESARKQELIAIEERRKAEAIAVEIAARVAELEFNATIESQRYLIAAKESEMARELRLSREAAVNEAIHIRKALELKSLEMEADLQMWKERRTLAEYEIRQLSMKKDIAAEETAQLELEAIIASHNASRAIQERLSKESEAYTAAMNVQLETEKRTTETAKADAYREERLLREAEAKVYQTQSEYEMKRATAEALIERARSERDEENRKGDENLRLRLLQEEDKLLRARENARLQKEEESAQRKEELHLAAELKLLEARKEMDKDVAMETTKLEIEGKIREARENEDIHARAAKAAAEAERSRLLEAVTTALNGIGEGLRALVTDYLDEVILGFGGIAIVIYASKEGFVLARQELSRLFGQPSLVRETSRKNGIYYWIKDFVIYLCVDLLPIYKLLQFLGIIYIMQQLYNGYEFCRRFISRTKSTDIEPSSRDPFADVIMSIELEKHVRTLAHSTTNAHHHHAPLRHAMFYGPPGTGKTMVAQRLAKYCGLEYAIMSGGDVAPLGAAAVGELNKLFVWAKSTKRGLLLFIDEAEAFLASRSRSSMSEDMRNSLSALLHHTGEQSNRFMLVLATNRPGDLDSAVADRIDEALYFGAPNEAERLRLGRLYFYKHVASRSQYASIATPTQPIPNSKDDRQRYSISNQPGKNSIENGNGSWISNIFSSAFSQPQILIENDVTTDMVDTISRQAHGFSGRQIAKLMLTVQAMVYSSTYVTKFLSTKTKDSSNNNNDNNTQNICTLTAKLLTEALEAEQEKLGRRLATGGSSDPTDVNNGGTILDPATAFYAGISSPELLRRQIAFSNQETNTKSTLSSSSSKGNTSNNNNRSNPNIRGSQTNRNNTRNNNQIDYNNSGSPIPNEDDGINSNMIATPGTGEAGTSRRMNRNGSPEE